MLPQRQPPSSAVGVAMLLSLKRLPLVLPSVRERHPYRRVVRGALPAARLPRDVALLETVRGLGREQQVVDPEALVALPTSGLIVPEGIAVWLGVKGPEGVREPEVEKGAELGPAFGPAERVVLPGDGIVNVL